MYGHRLAEVMSQKKEPEKARFLDTDRKFLRDNAFSARLKNAKYAVKMLCCLCNA